MVVARNSRKQTTQRMFERGVCSSVYVWAESAAMGLERQPDLSRLQLSMLPRMESCQPDRQVMQPGLTGVASDEENCACFSSQSSVEV
jgi:hypothetical protein